MNAETWGALADPPATMRWWRMRLRARRFACLRRARDEADLVAFWYGLTAETRGARWGHC